MDMQDKEFDKLFSSKFEDFEAEPSPLVWDNITGELDGKGSKRSLLPWLSIAASVIVLVTVGVIFLQQKPTVTKPDNNNNQVAQNHLQPSVVKGDETETDETVAAIAKPNDNTLASNQRPGNIIDKPVDNGIKTNVTNDNPTKEAEAPKTDNPQLIAAVIEPPHEIIKETTPDKLTQPAPKVIDIAAHHPLTEKPAIATVNYPAPVKKHGIRSLGGLVNVLVAAVDKRQDKLVEFTDSDDDDTQSTLTGVNLGIIKVKRQ